jgi:hypothetical protein
MMVTLGTKANLEIKKRNLITPLTVGLAIGFLATLAQAFFQVYPPAAYGICTVCHARDLINWVTNKIFNTNLGVAGVSMDIPVLTVLGIFIGASAGAVKRKEFRIRKTANPLFEFVLGIAVMVSALTLGGCTIRIPLRVAYGDATALIGLISKAGGVILGSIYLKRSMRP